MDVPNETNFQTFQLNIERKNIGVNKTANSVSFLKTGHLSKMSDPLSFRFSGKVRRQLLLGLGHAVSMRTGFFQFVNYMCQISIVLHYV